MTDTEGTWVEQYFDWHTAFASQGVAMVIIGLLFCFFDNKNIDILRCDDEQDGMKFSEVMKSQNARSKQSQEEIIKEWSWFDQMPVLNEVAVLLKNPIYMLITLTITVFFFSATGLQFWTLSYFVQVMHVKQLNAQIAFVFCCTTAPIPGALLGSSIADSYVSLLHFYHNF